MICYHNVYCSKIGCSKLHCVTQIASLAVSIAHDRFGSSIHVQQNGSLSHPQDLDGPMRVAAQRKTNAYKQTCADNQNISFLPLS